MLKLSKLVFRNQLNVGGYSRLHSSGKPVAKVIGLKEKPDVTEITDDWIGPPDKECNIRPILRHTPDNETNLQQELREKRLEVQGWTMRFWKDHNKRFFEEKDEFVLIHRQPNEATISADKMSEFYKAFLDKNWKMHALFNVSWYLKNFDLLVLALQVNAESAYLKVRGKK